MAVHQVGVEEGTDLAGTNWHWVVEIEVTEKHFDGTV